MSRRTVVVYSGGLDSTTLLYHLIDLGNEVKAISFDYGQRHRKELDAAKKIADLLRIDRRIVNVSGLAEIFGSNALTDQAVDVPHGEYAPQNMQVTVVPNRNMIMLSIATGWAISLDYDSVAFGAHSGEYTPYPDCQPQFAAAMNAATHVCGDQLIEVLAPFVRWSKSDIARRGIELRVPFELTWSCYEGGDEPCERCSTCLDRSAAFSLVASHDPMARSNSRKIDANLPTLDELRECSVEAIITYCVRAFLRIEPVLTDGRAEIRDLFSSLREAIMPPFEIGYCYHGGHSDCSFTGIEHDIDSLMAKPVFNESELECLKLFRLVSSTVDLALMLPELIEDEHEDRSLDEADWDGLKADGEMAASRESSDVNELVDSQGYYRIYQSEYGTQLIENVHDAVANAVSLANGTKEPMIGDFAKLKRLSDCGKMHLPFDLSDAGPLGPL